MFEKELSFFVSHQDELVARYGGKTLVIRGDQIEGAYDTPLSAYVADQAKFRLGTFMLQPCEPGPGAYTVTIAMLEA
jgi:hypothetical protein